LYRNDPGFYPIEKMFKCLSLIYSQEDHEDVEDILEIDLYQLKIRINLVSHEIWRRVLVPSTFSFRHHIILFKPFLIGKTLIYIEFVVERAERKDLNIVMDDDPETMEYLNFDAFDIRQERFVDLEETFPTNCEVGK
jgi:hypothetical protein